MPRKGRISQRASQKSAPNAKDEAFTAASATTETMNAISTNYRELSPDEVAEVAERCAAAWQCPEIPRRQYESAVRNELRLLRLGEACAPFAAFLECMRRLPIELLAEQPTLLDVGASAGYYREVLAIAGFNVGYTGFDYSAAFQAFAEQLYPGIVFDIGEARALPYLTDAFDIVLHGACIMHVRDYPRLIAEAARVARRYVLFHRSPILRAKPTTFFVKEAYGVECLEIHFNEAELLGLFRSFGLEPVYDCNVFWDPRTESGHRDYLLKKTEIEPYASIKSV